MTWPRLTAMVEIDRYDYELPKHLIAQAPLARRADARMLVVDRGQKSLEHHYIRDLPGILREPDCLVLNDTRVVPARLVGVRTDTGGRWEGLYLESDAQRLWRVISKTRGRLTPGETVTLIDPAGRRDILLRMVAREAEGVWVARPESEEEVLSLLERVGRVPLPPYIRKGEMVECDRETYQTVFAENPGAVAAPTAGLHFTRPLLQSLEKQGVRICRVTLHVGLGTFRPIEVQTLAEHHMHSEWGKIDEGAIELIQGCRARGGRVVAVGTTAVRILETAAAGGGLKPYCGQTDLFIRPPYTFRVADVLLTNFHLPKTTLLVLVKTFGGDELIRQAYEEAIREEYRFYSYGDAMLVL